MGQGRRPQRVGRHNQETCPRRGAGATADGEAVCPPRSLANNPDHLGFAYNTQAFQLTIPQYVV
jgi:hypothetical protein